MFCFFFLAVFGLKPVEFNLPSAAISVVEPIECMKEDIAEFTNSGQLCMLMEKNHNVTSERDHLERRLEECKSKQANNQSERIEDLKASRYQLAKELKKALAGRKNALREKQEMAVNHLKVNEERQKRFQSELDKREETNEKLVEEMEKKLNAAIVKEEEMRVALYEMQMLHWKELEKRNSLKYYRQPQDKVIENKPTTNSKAETLEFENVKLEHRLHKLLNAFNEKTLQTLYKNPLRFSSGKDSVPVQSEFGNDSNVNQLQMALEMERRLSNSIVKEYKVLEMYLRSRQKEMEQTNIVYTKTIQSLSKELENARSSVRFYTDLYQSLQKNAAVSTQRYQKLSLSHKNLQTEYKNEKQILNEMINHLAKELGRSDSAYEETTQRFSLLENERDGLLKILNEQSEEMKTIVKEAKLAKSKDFESKAAYKQTSKSIEYYRDIIISTTNELQNYQTQLNTERECRIFQNAVSTHDKRVIQMKLFGQLRNAHKELSICATESNEIEIQLKSKSKEFSKSEQALNDQKLILSASMREIHELSNALKETKENFSFVKGELSRLTGQCEREKISSNSKMKELAEELDACESYTTTLMHEKSAAEKEIQQGKHAMETSMNECNELLEQTNQKLAKIQLAARQLMV